VGAARSSVQSASAEKQWTSTPESKTGGENQGALRQVLVVSCEFKPFSVALPLVFPALSLAYWGTREVIQIFY
jgi:hypothetical protein